MPAPPSLSEGQPGRSAGDLPRRCSRQTLPLSMVDEYAQTTRAAHLDGERRRAGERLRRAEVRRARRRRSAQARGARHRHRRGRDRDHERERQPADRHDLRRRTDTSSSRPTASCCGRRRTGRSSSRTATAIPVRLDEVAHVYDGVENDKIGGWFKGERAIYLAIQQAAGHERRRRSSTPSRRCCRRSARSCRRR